MPIKQIVVVFLFAVLFHNFSYAQSSTVFQSILYNRSVAAGGLGEQGVAGTALDAMQYNPANLVYSDKISLSFFNNPWNILGWHTPLIAGSTSFALSNGAVIGFDYTYLNYGTFNYGTVEDPISGSSFHAYERSVAAAYAIPLSENIAIGLQARYVWFPVYKDQELNHLLFSAGVTYKPELFERRMTIGFSLMNFSTAVKSTVTHRNEIGAEISTTYSDSPPSQINLGISESIIANNFFDITLSIGGMKPIVKQNGAPDYDGQSSFSALIDDWDDFPKDGKAQAGFGFLFHPIDLGNNLSFFQEMTLGYCNVGPKEGGAYNFFTHGVTIGIQHRNVKLTAGYAGRWYTKTDVYHYFTQEFPWETVQFTLSSNADLFGTMDETESTGRTPANIILSGGFTYGEPLGKLKKISASGVMIENAPANQWSLVSDFYIDENSAILTAFSYARMKETMTITYPTFAIQYPFEIDIETVTLESGFRYHLLEDLHPFFIQASLGIIRMNPIIKTNPRYFYQPYDEIAFGCVLPVMESGFVIIAKAGLKTMLMKEFPDDSHIGGYNQVTYGVNVGYTL